MKTIKSKKVTLAVVVILWTIIAILLAMAMSLNHRGPNFNFMGPTPVGPSQPKYSDHLIWINQQYWCWVNRYELGLGWKAALEYIWLWVTLAVSLLIYIPLYLWMRGNLVIDEDAWWKSSLKLSTDKNPENQALRRKSLVMLAWVTQSPNHTTHPADPSMKSYPAVNCICILSISATRWKSLVQGHGTVPPAATFAAFTLFALSGFFNVVLLLKTRPASGLFGQLMFRLPVKPPLLHERDGRRCDVEMTDLGRAPP